MSRLRAVLARVRESAWSALVARGAVVILALLLLAWIGRAPGGRALAADDAGVPEPRNAPPAMTTAANGAVAAPTPVALAAPTAASTATPLASASSTAAPPGRAQGRATPEDPVYLNSADVEELRRLPGIGPKRAQAILALRQRVGRFQRVEELLRVKGIGRATLRKWRALVRLDIPPQDAGA